MKTRNNKQKIIWVLVFAVMLNVLLAGLYVFVFGMVKKNIRDASVASFKLEEYLSKEGKVSVVKKAVRDTKIYREKLDNYFVNLDDVPLFASKIESLAEVSGVDPINITILEQKGSALMIEFETKGGFSNILHLLQLVESLPFKVNVTKSYISKIGNFDGDKKIKWHGVFGVEIIGFLDNQKNG